MFAKNVKIAEFPDTFLEPNWFWETGSHIIMISLYIGVVWSYDEHQLAHLKIYHVNQTNDFFRCYEPESVLYTDRFSGFAGTMNQTIYCMCDLCMCQWCCCAFWNMYDQCYFVYLWAGTCLSSCSSSIEERRCLPIFFEGHIRIYSKAQRPLVVSKLSRVSPVYSQEVLHNDKAGWTSRGPQFFIIRSQIFQCTSTSSGILGSTYAQIMTTSSAKIML